MGIKLIRFYFTNAFDVLEKCIQISYPIHNWLKQKSIKQLLVTLLAKCSLPMVHEEHNM